MTVYSFYIFDRHSLCIYSKRWALPPGSTTATKPGRPQSGSSITSNGDTETLEPSTTRTRRDQDDAKLVFGTVYSLRNMVRKLGGSDDNFLSYRTGQYKLHYYETPTNLKFVMLTDTRANNLQIVLHQIYVNLYVEYVVKNPLSPVEHPNGEGVANELFEMGLESFINAAL